jgi:hypothetical protein
MAIVDVKPGGSESVGEGARLVVSVKPTEGVAITET